MARTEPNTTERAYQTGSEAIAPLERFSLRLHLLW